MSLDNNQTKITIQQHDKNNTINQTQHYDSYLYIGFIFLIFILIFWILINKGKRKKEEEILKNSINIDDIEFNNDDNDRKTIEKAIAENDIKFLKESLNSPVLSEENKKIIKNFFKNKKQ